MPPKAAATKAKTTAAPKPPAKAASKPAAKKPAKKKAAKKKAAAGPKVGVGDTVLYVLQATNAKGEHEVRPALVVRIPEVATADPNAEVVERDAVNAGTREGAAERRAAGPVTREPAPFLNLVVFCDGQNDTEIQDSGGSAWIANVLHDAAGAPGTWHPKP